MSATEHVLQLEQQAIEVTPGEVRKAGQFFWRGHSNESPYEELVLEISRKLKTSEPPIRVVKKERSESIAMLVKVLTGSRSLREAKDYLNTADGKAWLRRQWRPREATSMASLPTDTADEPGSPIIAVMTPEPIVLTTGQAADRLQHIDLGTETLTGSLEGLPAAAMPYASAELEHSTVAQSASPASPRQSSAHSRTQSDMSIDFSAQRCPRCQQIHPDHLVALGILQVLEQYGYGVDGNQSSGSASARQNPGTNGDRVTSPANIAPGCHTMAVEPRPGTPTRGSARRRGWYVDMILMVWLLWLTLVYMEFLPKHASRAS